MPRTIIARLVVLGLLAVVGGCAGGAPKPAERTTIAVVPWPASAPLYIAYDKGYFRDEGLDATLLTVVSGHLGLEAMLAGQADFAATSETPIARAAVEGKPVAVIATVAEIDEAIKIIARKDKGISGPEDLRGKKVGLTAGTAAEFFLDVYLTTSYVRPADVQTVNIGADTIVDAFLNGEVDAVSTWSPHTLVLRQRLGSSAVVLADPSIYTMTWNIAVSSELAQNNPERVKRFLRAILRATRFMEGHADEAYAISERHIGTNSALYEREWKDYRFTAVLDQSLVMSLERQARWILSREASGDRSTPNVLDLVYAEGLKAVQPDAVRVPGK